MERTAIFTSNDSTFFAEVLWCAAHHQPGDEDRKDDEHDHAVETGANAAENDFAEHDVDHRYHAPEGGE
jgi:hypothetical protein